jgi:hypothetical protein
MFPLKKYYTSEQSLRKQNRQKHTAPPTFPGFISSFPPQKTQEGEERERRGREKRGRQSSVHAGTLHRREMAMRMAAAAVALVAVMGVLAPRAAAQTPNCAEKLIPCSPYMNTTGTPPDTCCGPLKDAVQNDLKCLCDLYASPEIFKAFNISLDQALGLSKRCGLSDTTAACKGNSTSILKTRFSRIRLMAISCLPFMCNHSGVTRLRSIPVLCSVTEFP